MADSTSAVAEVVSTVDETVCEAEGGIVEDVLVEEVSIDGMCGVY